MPHSVELPAVAAEHGHEGGGLKEKAKEVWHGIKEITPGTKVGRRRCSVPVVVKQPSRMCSA